MTSETGEQLAVFTDADRRMLREIHAILREIEPHLVHLPALSELAANPVLRFRRSKRAVPEN